MISIILRLSYNHIEAWFYSLHDVGLAKDGNSKIEIIARKIITDLKLCVYWPQNHMISIILYCDKKFTKISKPWKIFESNHKIV